MNVVASSLVRGKTLSSSRGEAGSLWEEAGSSWEEARSSWEDVLCSLWIEVQSFPFEITS